MKILRNVSDFCVLEDAPIKHALKKIEANKERIIFVVDEAGQLMGAVSDGDFRRFVLTQEELDLNAPIKTLANTKCMSLKEGAPPQKIRGSLNQKILAIPIVDGRNRVVAVALRARDEIRIGAHRIDRDSPSFVIAEIGNNHNGSVARAKELVDLAKRTGADCAKFQMRDLKSLYRNKGVSDDAKEDLGSQYTLDILERFNLSQKQLFEVFDHCKKVGILPLCTPWDEESVSALEAYGMPAYKVASADLTNHDLLSRLIRTGKPLIISTGMSTEAEIKQTADLLNESGVTFVFLHCNSTYPAPFKDINLRFLTSLAEIGKCFVGYSGHERGIAVAVAAVAMGAKVIEKHFTTDRNLEGNDHKVSLLPDEFARMVTEIREVEESLGSLSSNRILTQGERLNREVLAKSLVINCTLKQGETILESMIAVKSPGTGLQPNRKKDLIGRKAVRDFAAGDVFFDSDVREIGVQSRPYKIKRPWGLPVRFHDFEQLTNQSNPSLLEFHVSYKDLEFDFATALKGRQIDKELIVHAPELFANDHLLDLCASEAAYRDLSIHELKRVVKITKELRQYFTVKVPTKIIVNCGGFSFDRPMPVSERPAKYKMIQEAFEQCEDDLVELLPQTMPPFPWHFGGQRFHSLFIDAEEIVAFCRMYKTRVCFDVSHSKLACNYFKWSFHDFVEKVAPFTAHIHMVDAAGVDDEGLQIGEGEVDFALLAKQFEKLNQKASFIPEIWQGHKNNGEGFWIALDRLETWF